VTASATAVIPAVMNDKRCAARMDCLLEVSNLPTHTLRRD
jgi:hypothetical protein